MKKRIPKIIGAVLAAGVLVAGFGCGEETPSAQDLLTGDSSDEFNAKLEELKQAEMSVEIIINGQSEGKWSQNDKGSWRWESSGADASYVIYNADMKKTWVVSGNSATEYTDAVPGPYQGFSPAMLLSSFGALAHLPRSGGSDDTWEWSISGAGYLTIEFKGPDGLITKITDEDDLTGETDVTEFKYTDVGDVPDSMFELPAGVSVQTTGPSPAP